MGLLDFFKKKPFIQEERDWVSSLPRELVEGFLKKIKENPQACNTDEIPNLKGEFGLEKTNPIPTYGIPNNETYLYSLRTSNGDVLRYRRNGSIEVDSINEPVDEYEIYNYEGDVIAYLYLSPYHWKTSTKAPIGFYVNGQSKRTARNITSPKVAFKQKSAYEEYQTSLKAEEQRKERAKERLERLNREAAAKARAVEEYQTAKYKPDWKKYKGILSQQGITSLYHFTDRSNLQSIKQHGALFSWHHCDTNSILIPVPGGNQLSRDLDTSKGLQDFVRVSFTRSHPMMFVQPIRSRDNVILEIDTEIIFWNGTKYANMNATRNEVNVGDTLGDFNQLRFDLFKFPNHFGLNETDRPYFQGEILVPTKIPLQFIKNLDDITT